MSGLDIEYGTPSPTLRPYSTNLIGCEHPLIRPNMLKQSDPIYNTSMEQTFSGRSVIGTGPFPSAKQVAQGRPVNTRPIVNDNTSHNRRTFANDSEWKAYMKSFQSGQQRYSDNTR